MNKKNRIIKYLLFFFTCIIVSCNNKKEAIPINVIPVASAVGNSNLPILNLSDYATEIKYIPLETNDSVLIGRNPKISSYENKKILIDFLAPSGNYYLFDENGKYCRKIGQNGQGPDEYLLVAQNLIHNNHIYLRDGEKMLIYDFNGSRIERYNMFSNDIPAKYGSAGINIFPLKKDTFVMSVLSLDGDYPLAILAETYQSGIKMIKEYPNFAIINKLRLGIKGGEMGFMYRFKDDVRIYKLINDTIFTIGQDIEMKPAFVLDLGKYKLPLSYIEWKEEVDINNYITLNRIYESLNHLFIQFHFRKYAPEPVAIMSRDGRLVNSLLGEVCSIFDKRTGEFTLLRQPVKGKLGFKNDIDGGPVIWPQYISSSNELVSLIQPEEFMDYYGKITSPSAELTELANKIEWDDNPIVIVAKLK